jgi:hypothetical protein
VSDAGDRLIQLNRHAGRGTREHRHGSEGDSAREGRPLRVSAQALRAEEIQTERARGARHRHGSEGERGRLFIGATGREGGGIGEAKHRAIHKHLIRARG